MADLDRARGGQPDIGAARIGPPPEVLEGMADAAERFDELRRQGYEVRFVGSQGAHGTAIELRDPRGEVRVLSVSEAVELAAGRSGR